MLKSIELKLKKEKKIEWWSTASSIDGRCVTNIESGFGLGHVRFRSPDTAPWRVANNSSPSFERGCHSLLHYWYTDAWSGCRPGAPSNFPLPPLGPTGQTLSGVKVQEFRRWSYSGHRSLNFDRFGLSNLNFTLLIGPHRTGEIGYLNGSPTLDSCSARSWKSCTLSWAQVWPRWTLLTMPPI